MDLNAAVRATRQALEQSQQAFATRLGISISGLANYERDRVPPLNVLLALVKAAKDNRVPRDARESILMATYEDLRRNIGEEDSLVFCPPGSSPTPEQAMGIMVLKIRFDEGLDAALFHAALRMRRRGGEEGQRAATALREFGIALGQIQGTDFQNPWGVEI